MYKKNIIDIQQAGSTILLIKRTDNLQNLPKIEQEALDQLFPGHETIFNVNSNTKLMFNRFIKKLMKSGYSPTSLLSLVKVEETLLAVTFTNLF